MSDVLALTFCCVLSTEDTFNDSVKCDNRLTHGASDSTVSVPCWVSFFFSSQFCYQQPIHFRSRNSNSIVPQDDDEVPQVKIPIIFYDYDLIVDVICP